VNVLFKARCLACEWKIEVFDYLQRSQKVGEHRVSTGHNVHMWLEPGAEES
jgi:hypothetical protein